MSTNSLGRTTLPATSGSGSASGGGGGGVVQWNEQQVFYVGKHGAAPGPGTSINQAFLTFTQAINAAMAAVPATNNRFSIVCLDDGVYTESIQVPAWCGIDAPNAKLSGTVALLDDAWAVFDEVEVGNAIPAAVLKPSGTGTSIASIRKIIAGDGSGGVLNMATAGLLKIDFESITVGAGSYGIGILGIDQGDLEVNGKRIVVGAGSTAVARSNAGLIVGSIDRITETGAATGVDAAAGEINLSIGSLETTTSHDVAGGATATLRCGSITGAYGAVTGDTDVVTTTTADRTAWINSDARPPLNVTERAAPPAGQVVVGDIYLDDGTNTLGGLPGWRRCVSVGPDVWEDIGATGGGGVVQWAEQQVLYVGKHGNDLNPGTAINLAFLTLNAAIIAAVLAGGGVGNPYAIVVLDDGVYVENIILPAGISVYAPNATLTGAINIDDACWSVFDTVQAPGFFLGALIGKALGGVGDSYVRARKIIAGDAQQALLNLALGSTLHVKAERVQVGIGSQAVGTILMGQGEVDLDIDEIVLAGAGATSVSRSAGGRTTGRIGRVIESGGGIGACTGVNADAGTVDLVIGLLDTFTSYTTNVGAVLNLVVAQITGTPNVVLAPPNVLTALSATRIAFGDSAFRPPVNFVARNAAPSGVVVVGDHYSDDGTNTSTRVAGLRRCVSLTPDVWRDIAPRLVEPCWISQYLYVETGVPTNDLIGQFMFDAAGLIDVGGNPNATVNFWVMLTLTLAGAGSATVTLYDLGASPGPPGGAPTPICTLTYALSGGPVYLEQVLAVSAGGPGANTIQNSARLYEARITMAAAAADTALVGCGGFGVR